MPDPGLPPLPLHFLPLAITPADILPGNYAALAQLGNSQVTLGDRVAVGITPASLGNKNLQWEKTTQYNIGLDIDLFNERLSLTGDAYYKKTSDLLLIRRVPRYTGYSQYLDNIGSTENRGLELSLTTQNIATSSLSWSTGLQFTVNRNKVLNLSDGEPLLVGTPISYASGQSFRIIQEGRSLGAFYGYEYGGGYTTMSRKSTIRLQRPLQPGPATPTLQISAAPKACPTDRSMPMIRPLLAMPFPILYSV
ncbi:TonB-dependent receptor domain-containing protein [Fodinibius sediminis]|uniref:TonB dependent receptor n=1 Tax=Fodinibius sediminis TaxID=1214077 RepID=A0A521AAI9_9BACT|nr:TonB-dependent receptor [Fodinibius sediminis]SMO31822.1 TonB dependent receptor [Fodinibius sediminis]